MAKSRFPGKPKKSFNKVRLKLQSFDLDVSRSCLEDAIPKSEKKNCKIKKRKIVNTRQIRTPKTMFKKRELIVMKDRKKWKKRLEMQKKNESIQCTSKSNVVLQETSLDSVNNPISHELSKELNSGDITSSLQTDSSEECFKCMVCKSVTKMEQINQFQANVCSICKKFISLVTNLTDKVPVPILPCLQNIDKCTLSPIVGKPKLDDILSSRCKGCWLKACLHLLKLPIDQKSKLNLMLPNELQLKIPNILIEKINTKINCRISTDTVTNANITNNKAILDEKTTNLCKNVSRSALKVLDVPVIPTFKRKRPYINTHFLRTRSNCNKKFEDHMYLKSEKPKNTKLISVTYLEELNLDEINSNGFAVIIAKNSIVKPICFLCGSSGQNELIFCANCCEPYHLFCIKNANSIDKKDHYWKLNWLCERCILCNFCGKVTKNKVQCEKCLKSYHPDCFNKKHLKLNIKSICSECLKCHSCSSEDQLELYENYLYCSNCLNLRKIGNYCPVCFMCYEHNDRFTKMIECNHCGVWTHIDCEKITKDQYYNLVYLWEHIEYNCVLCSEQYKSNWKSEIQNDLKLKFLYILTCLSMENESQELLKLISKKNIKMDVCSDKLISKSNDLTNNSNDVNNTLKNTKDELTLSIVQKNINDNKYLLIKEFQSDVESVLRNCENFDNLIKSFRRSLLQVFEWHYQNSGVESLFEEIHKNVVNSEKNSFNENTDKVLPSNFIIDNNDGNNVDKRICTVCKVIGDRESSCEGRLLYCSYNKWIHANCALWSFRVLEKTNGLLQNVHSAISNSRFIKCRHCNKKGASVCCYSNSCSAMYHFGCALISHCYFMNDKSVFCLKHASPSNFITKDVIIGYNFNLERPIYIKFYESLNQKQHNSIKRNIFVNAKNVNVAIGSLTIHDLGNYVSKYSDLEDVIVPVNFQCTRLYWSTVHPWKLIPYSIKVSLIKSKNDNISIDSSKHFVVDHTLPQDVIQQQLNEIAQFHNSLKQSEMTYTKFNNNLHSKSTSQNNLNKEMSNKVPINELQINIQSNLDDNYFNSNTTQSRTDKDVNLVQIDGSNDDEASDTETKVDSNKSNVTICKEKQFFLEYYSRKLSPKSMLYNENDNFSKLISNETIINTKQQQKINILANTCQNLRLSINSSNNHDDENNNFVNIKKDIVDDSNAANDNNLEIEVNSDDEKISLCVFSDTESDDNYKLMQLDGNADMECSSLDENDSIINNKEISDDNDVDNDKPINCKVCHYTYRTKESYARHLSQCFLPEINFNSDNFENKKMKLNNVNEDNIFAQTTQGFCQNMEELTNASQSQCFINVNSSYSFQPQIEYQQNQILINQEPIQLQLQTETSQFLNMQPFISTTPQMIPIQSNNFNSNVIVPSNILIQENINSYSLATESIPFLMQQSPILQSTGASYVNIFSEDIQQIPSFYLIQPSQSLIPTVMQSFPQTTVLPQQFFFYPINTNYDNCNTSILTNINTEIKTFPTNLGIIPASENQENNMSLKQTNIINFQASPSTTTINNNISSSITTETSTMTIVKSNSDDLSNNVPKIDKNSMEEDQNGTDSIRKGQNDKDSEEKSDNDSEEKNQSDKDLIEKDQNDIKAIISNATISSTSTLLNSILNMDENSGNIANEIVLSKDDTIIDKVPNLKTKNIEKVKDFHLDYDKENDKNLDNCTQVDDNLKLLVKTVIKNMEDDNLPKLIFEISTNEDIDEHNKGLSLKSTSFSEIWTTVLDLVQKAREKYGLKSFSKNDNIQLENYFDVLGLKSNQVRFLLKQFTKNCKNPKRKFNSYLKNVDDNNFNSNIKRFDSENGTVSNYSDESSDFDTYNNKFNKNNLSSRCREFQQKNKSQDEFGSGRLSKNRVKENILKAIENKSSNGLFTIINSDNKNKTSKSIGVFPSSIHGCGVFCLNDLECGIPVIQYTGEVVRSSVADKRERLYSSRGIGCYMFRIDDNFVIDATMKGNAARFINHSCEPNCFSKVIETSGKKQIFIFTLKKITKGEELTYDYKFPLEDDKIPCKCDSRKCRKYLN